MLRCSEKAIRLCGLSTDYRPLPLGCVSCCLFRRAQRYKAEYYWNIRSSELSEAFAKLRKATISFLSVRPQETTRLLLDRFWLNLVFKLLFRKIVFKIQVQLKFKCDGVREATVDNKIRHMHFACWESKFASTGQRVRAHTHIQTMKYVIFIVFQRRQWFRELASALRYCFLFCPIAHGFATDSS